MLGREATLRRPASQTIWKETNLNRTRSLFAVLALSVIPVVAAGCGDDEGSGDDPQDILEATFSNEESLESGVIDLSFSVGAEGAQGGSFDVALTGPFAAGEDEDSMGQADLDLTVSAEGAAAQDFEDIEAGLLITEDNLFVDYQGDTYELGEEMFADLAEQQAAAAPEDGEDAASSFQEGCAQAIEAQGGDAAACDIDLTTWFGGLENEGTEDKGGAETNHISGELDLETMIGDLFELGSSVPGATGGVDPALLEGQLDSISSAFEDATFDVYSATEDDTLRGLDLTLALDTAALGAGALGVDSADLSFALEISDVGSEQTFSAPEDAKPIDDLLGQFGGLDALGGGGLPGAGGAEEPALPGAGGSIDPDCLKEAGDDPEAIADCL